MQARLEMALGSRGLQYFEVGKQKRCLRVVECLASSIASCQENKEVSENRVREMLPDYDNPYIPSYDA